MALALELHLELISTRISSARIGIAAELEFPTSRWATVFPPIAINSFRVATCTTIMWISSSPDTWYRTLS